MGADYLFGSGLRKDGNVPNGASLPAYFCSGIGVGAPQFGPRRGVYLTVQKDF